MQPTWFHLSRSLNHRRPCKHLHVLSISSVSQSRCLTERCKHPVGGGLRATQLALFLLQEGAQLSESVITSAADLKSASCLFSDGCVESTEAGLRSVLENLTPSVGRELTDTRSQTQPWSASVSLDQPCDPRQYLWKHCEPVMQDENKKIYIQTV